MARAHYSARRVLGVVLVEDANDGVMSVTNDAEAVVSEVVKCFGDFPIKYCDTDGRWDWLVHDHGIFKRFAPGYKPYPSEAEQ